MTGMSASAADPNYPTPNTSDSSWSVNVSGSSTYVRKKNDTSSVYVHNKSSYAINVSVYARSTQTGANKDAGQRVGYTYFQTTSLSIPANSKRAIRQWIRENGYAWAALTVYGGSYNGGSGVWSPDSTGTYTFAN